MNYSLHIIQYTKTTEYIPVHPLPSGSAAWHKLLGTYNDQWIVANGRELALVDASGNLLWKHKVLCPAMPECIWLSDERMLVKTKTEDYHVWGMLGPMLLVDLNEGTIIKELKGQHAASLPDGSFIVGLEGYGYFDSWLYDSAVAIRQHWKSYGHYIIDDTDIRVIEQDRNNPTHAHVVRLTLNGSIIKGPKLASSHASEPIVLGNKDVVFVNSGNIRIINAALEYVTTCSLLAISETESWRFSCNITYRDNLFVVDIYERTVDVPIQYFKHSWLIDIKKQD